MHSWTQDDLTIIVDHRERPSGLIASLQEMDLFEIKEEKLEVCDVVVGDIGIERKTGDDLVDSLLDGRLFRQLIFMRRLYRRRALLIEGAVPVQKLSQQKQDGLWMKISIGLNTPIVRSTNVSHSARLIHRAAIQAYGLASPRITTNGKQGGADVEFYQRLALVSLPGIGLTRAKNLLAHFRSLRAIFNASKEELMNVPEIGPHQAEVIVAMMGEGHAR